MVEKSSFTSLMLYCLVFIVLTNKGFADRQLLLEQADSYLESSNYQQAKSTYRQVVSDYPWTYYALEAQKQLTITYIAWDKEAERQTAYQKLLTDYSSDPELAKAVWDIAEHQWDADKKDKAVGYYEDVVYDGGF